MRSTKWLLLIVAIGLSPTLAHANTVDPPLIVDAALSCGVGYSCAPITGLNFSFMSPAGPHGVLHYTNMSGVNWHSLILTETGEPAIAITCTSNLFGCRVVPYGKNGARVVLTASGSLPGILAGKSFEIGLGCRGDCLSWPSDLEFTAIANIAPEPGTGLLLLAGLSTMIGRRRSTALRRSLRRRALTCAQELK